MRRSFSWELARELSGDAGRPCRCLSLRRAIFFSRDSRWAGPTPVPLRTPSPGLVSVAYALSHQHRDVRRGLSS